MLLQKTKFVSLKFSSIYAKIYKKNNKNELSKEKTTDYLAQNQFNSSVSL